MKNLKELEYPFDAEYIVSNKRRLKRELLENLKNSIPVKIAILGGGTTSNITQILELFLLNYGIKPEFYESEYHQYFEDAMFPNERLEKFAPDIIYLCTSIYNIQKFPCISDTEDGVEKMLRDETEKYIQMWDRLQNVYHCIIIQNNFELPYYRLLGNRDAFDIHGGVNFVTRLNMEFYRYAKRQEHFFICDVNYISADYGLKKWSDPMYWYMYKYAAAVPAIPYLSFQVANIVKSLLGKNKKGMICDLDNTLWGGVIGEDGVENIVIGEETPEGQAYLAFQKYVKTQKQLGIVLCINSKNDEENAYAGLEHPDCILKKKDFISIKANWNPKDENCREIAEELSLLPESLVFLDDNFAERHIVTSQIPEMAVPKLTSVSSFIEIIDRSGFFETTIFTDDDGKRFTMYQENEKRKEASGAFSNYGEYLKSLEMKAVIRPFEAVSMARIVQLTNKSNQFNLTTKRYTRPEVEKIAANPEYITLYGRLKDKFGDNGIVALVIGHVAGSQCHIDLWLMSCRVLKRDMEAAMMDTFVKTCIKRGLTDVFGYYYPTAKNKMVEDFYEQFGFLKEADLKDSGTKWRLDLKQKYKNKNKYIEVLPE